MLGTKNVGKSLKKIAEGPKKQMGVTWFPQLVDKRKFLQHSIGDSNTWCAILREKHQAASVLVHEELWQGSQTTSWLDWEHTQSLSGINSVPALLERILFNRRENTQNATSRLLATCPTTSPAKQSWRIQWPLTSWRSSCWTHTSTRMQILFAG